MPPKPGSARIETSAGAGPETKSVKAARTAAHAVGPEPFVKLRTGCSEAPAERSRRRLFDERDVQYLEVPYARGRAYLHQVTHPAADQGPRYR